VKTDVVGWTLKCRIIELNDCARSHTRKKC